MDKITEEVITSLIRRIEIIEEKQSRLSRPDRDGYYKPTPEKSPSKRHKGLATEGQLRYLRILGAHIPEGMTKKDAGIEIDRLVKEKDSVETQPIVQEEIKTKEDAEKVADVEFEIVEPKEVDTDDVGVDGEGLM